MMEFILKQIFNIFNIEIVFKRYKLYLNNYNWQSVILKFITKREIWESCISFEIEHAIRISQVGN